MPIKSFLKTANKIMSEVVRFASASDVATISYTDATIPTTEADAIVLLDTDVLATSVTSVGGNTQGTLFIDFTKGSLTSVTIKIYGSYMGNPTATDWYQETEETSSSGVLTLNPLSIVVTATSRYEWHFPIGALRAAKITVLTTGTVTSSALKLSVGLRSN
jgi:hypothetical protein